MRILAAIVVLSVCAGCTTPEPEQGNLVGVDSVELVQDVVFALFGKYPPAHNRLAFMHKADDSFGVKLVESPRLHGYAVAEYVEPERKGWGAEEPPKLDGIPFAYLVAGTGIDNEIRVTLRIADESLSRLYEVLGEGEEVWYSPLGFWSRLENRAPGKEAEATGDV